MRFIIILFCFTFSVVSYSQSVTYNRNLPQIDVIGVRDNLIEPGKISIKWYRQKKERVFSEGNELEFKDESLEQIAKKYRFTKINSLFRNVLKDEEKINLHKKWNLDLWFSIEFDPTFNVKQLYLELKATNLFEVVEPVYKKHLISFDDGNSGLDFTPNDTQFNQQWSYQNTGQGGGKVDKDIKLIPAWDIEVGKPNVLVSVHDLGIQLNHPDLIQNIAVGKSFNFVDNTDTIVMGHHGTHVAGTIAAVNNNNIGVSGIAGGNGNGNSGIRLVSIQNFRANKARGFAEGFIYAADNGVCVSNNSWAYNEEKVYELSIMDAIDYFIENGGGNVLQGGLVIFAAGNVSRPLELYPSSYDRVISVAATNNRDEKANYSTYGPWIDISAPGGDFSNGAASQILSTSWYSGYAGDHGTSMACPHVSGVAALIASKLAGKASASDVRDIVLSTTDNIDSLNQNFIGLLGSGRLNALKALQKAENLSLNVVNAVDSFKIIENCNNFNLKWKSNTNNDSVMIAWSNFNNIGIPINGLNYKINDTLVKGGKIIYKGLSNNFLFNKNDSALHFFKIWSKNSSNNYSYGKAKEILSKQTINGSGVLVENFNYPPYFPTQTWRTVNPDKDISWIHTAADTANTGVDDDYSMCMYNYQNNTLLGAVDYLTSPYYKIQNVDSLQISFWYAYQYRNTGFAIADSLELLVSTDCGNSFTSIWKKGGMNLATVNNTNDTVFYPFGITKWKQVFINLSAFKNSDKIYFAFKSVNGKGNNLFIDNINLIKKYKRDISITNISKPNLPTCDKIINPEITVRNLGTQVVNNLTINYFVDNNSAIVTNWTGTLNTNDSTKIILNSSAVIEGKHLLKITMQSVNGLADEFLPNNEESLNFVINGFENLPLNEGFETNIFPKSNWTILQQPKDDITWVKTNLFGKGSGSSIVMKNYLYNNKGRIDDIISPVYNIDRNMDSAFVLFDYSHATRFAPNTLNDFDTLELIISKNCGVNWEVIWRKGGANLQTINQVDAYQKEFFPTQTQWKTDSIYLQNRFLLGDQIQLKFRNINQFGNNIYVDNIKMYSKYTTPQTKSMGYAVYPNPFNHQINIQHLSEPRSLKGIKIMDNLGRTLFIKQFNQSALKDEIINTSNYKSGVYLVELIYDNEIKIEKLIKLN